MYTPTKKDHERMQSMHLNLLGLQLNPWDAFPTDPLLFPQEINDHSFAAGADTATLSSPRDGLYGLSIATDPTETDQIDKLYPQENHFLEEAETCRTSSLLCTEEIEPESEEIAIESPARIYGIDTPKSGLERIDDENQELIYLSTFSRIEEESGKPSSLTCHEEIDHLSTVNASKKLFESIALGEIEKVKYLTSSYPNILLPPFHRTSDGVPLLVHCLKEKQIEIATILFEACKDKGALLLDRGVVSRNSMTFQEAAEYLPPCAIDLIQELSLDAWSSSIFCTLKGCAEGLIDSISSIEFSLDRKSAIQKYMSAVNQLKYQPDCSKSIATLILRLTKIKAIQDCKLLLKKGSKLISNTILWELLLKLSESGKTTRSICTLVEKVLIKKIFTTIEGQTIFIDS